MQADVMTTIPNPPPAFQKGYALCSPENILQPKTFAKSEKKAIAKGFKKPGRKKAWAEAVEQGWSVKLVYMRLFVPVFHSTSSSSVEIEEDED
ncbi:hypothetical protein [Agrobacterium larrymoorei]|nr:hypothetical protein [Agrobacterium larrymoorei]